MTKLASILLTIIFISYLFAQNKGSTHSGSKLATDTQKYRLELKIGSSTRTAELSENIIESHKEYAEQLKKGYNLSLSLLIFRKVWGNGLQISYFKSSHSSDQIYLLDDEGFIIGIGSREDNITVLFIGPEFYYQFKLNPLLRLYGKIAPGYISYSDKVHFVYSATTYSGKSYGIDYSFGFEYLFHNNVGFNLDISLLRALPVKIKHASNHEKESVNRYDINGGFVIYF